MTRNRLDPPDLTVRRLFLALAVSGLVFSAFFAWVAVSSAAAAVESPTNGAEVCVDERERVLLEHERTVVVQPEVTVTEQFFVKQVKVAGRWVDYDDGSVTRWESPDFTEEGWTYGVRYRYRAVEGESRTTVVTPAVTERLVEWFDGTPPEDGWNPTGNTQVTFIDVPVPCDELPCACPASLGVDCTPHPGCPHPEEPPVDEPACPSDPECPAPPGPEEPPVDHGPEPEADHTIDPQPTDPSPASTPTNTAGAPILPVTGIDPWDALLAVGFLAFVGAVCLWIGRTADT